MTGCRVIVYRLPVKDNKSGSESSAARSRILADQMQRPVRFWQVKTAVRTVISEIPCKQLHKCPVSWKCHGTELEWYDPVNGRIVSEDCGYLQALRRFRREYK